MPVFEYYDFENYILCNYYPYMTLACQGGAFVTGVLYRCDQQKLFCLMNVDNLFLLLDVFLASSIIATGIFLEL